MTRFGDCMWFANILDAWDEWLFGRRLRRRLNGLRKEQRKGMYPL